MQLLRLFLCFSLFASCVLAQNSSARIIGSALATAASAQVGVTVVYDPAYVSLKYPGGDVPMERGVCCDVVIRALRVHGVDLQKLVHEDMKAILPPIRRCGDSRQPTPTSITVACRT